MSPGGCEFSLGDSKVTDGDRKPVPRWGVIMCFGFICEDILVATHQLPLLSTNEVALKFEHSRIRNRGTGGESSI